MLPSDLVNLNRLSTYELSEPPEDIPPPKMISSESLVATTATADVICPLSLEGFVYFLWTIVLSTPP